MTQRRGALERARWVLADWRAATTRLAEVETRMVEVLDELGLTEYVTSIPGVGGGSGGDLAETGDPARFDSPRALVKHAGLCPRDNASGTFMAGRGFRRGRPGLRLAAWRAVGGPAHNPVMAARYRYLTSRDHNKLSDGQPEPPSPRRCCAGSTSSSLTGCTGMRHRRRSEIPAALTIHPNNGWAKLHALSATGDLARHHEQAPPVLTKLGAAVGTKVENSKEREKKVSARRHAGQTRTNADTRGRRVC